LQISFSGGADAFNLTKLLACGIRPVTMATTLLKPGGYERLHQLATLAEEAQHPAQSGIDVEGLHALAISAATATNGFERHHKGYRQTGSRKSAEPLRLFDCAEAPCSTSGCPINQQIPAYLEKVATGDLAAAFEIIANDNVLPSVTATICDHQCQNLCTRLDYDDPLQIRSAKKAASLAAQEAFIKRTKPSEPLSKTKVLVIGGGPAGLAAASYLRRNGVDVTVREIRDRLLGIVAHVIPDFRISNNEVALDVDMAIAQGVRIEYGADANYDLATLQKEYPYIIIATGAWEQGSGPLPLDGAQVIDALDFLERSKNSGLTLSLGRHVAVIGGGDVAMDCARAATRNRGVEQTTVVYRRTRALMPAQPEEIELAQTDGVIFRELHAPCSFAEGKLTCDIMELDEPEADGRPGISASGRQAILMVDTVISAVGAGVDTSAFAACGLEQDERGFARLNDVNESSLPGVYVAGDCKAGPRTVVQAMADAKSIARDILAKLVIQDDFRQFAPAACRDELLTRKGILNAAQPGPAAANAETPRCLTCNNVCEICVDVCPNRANVAIDLVNAPSPLVQRYQILHLDGLCNECGNCGTFCPSGGKPYRDKLTLYAREEDYDHSENCGFLPLGDGRVKLRLADGNSRIIMLPDHKGKLLAGCDTDLLPSLSVDRPLERDTAPLPDCNLGAVAQIQAVFDRYPYLLYSADMKE
jgi:putative selenate reductase